MRIKIRIHTRAPNDAVGGRYGCDDPPTLVVRVRAAPTEGLANAACVKALALAFGVPRSQVTIVTGARSRSKVVDVQGGDPVRLRRLLEASV
jgi:uncharacterized protein YggU (UPF0235/DUF167 family)